MHSTHNERKSVVPQRFIRALKNKIYKHIRANSENLHFNVLNDIVDKYNNTYHKSIKIKSIDPKRASFAKYKDPNMKTLMKKILNSK